MSCLINSDEVRMWVYEETLPSGEKLTDVINQTNVRTISSPICIQCFYLVSNILMTSVVK